MSLITNIILNYNNAVPTIAAFIIHLMEGANSRAEVFSSCSIDSLKHARYVLTSLERNVIAPPVNGLAG